MPGPNEPTALYSSSEVGSNKPTVPLLDQPNYPGTLYTFPSSPSASQPPSIPSSYVSSTMSSLKPSSSISNKRKANNDDVSMTSESATCGSVVSVASGASSSSRERRANRPASQDVSGLRDDLNALQSAFQVNFQANTDLMARIRSRPSNQPPQLITSLNAVNAAAEKRNAARTTLLEHEQDFLTPDELFVMFDVLRESNDNVDEYLLLATSHASTDDVRHGWLRRRIAEAKRSIDGTMEHH